MVIVTNDIRAVVEGREPDSQYLLATIFIILVYNISESELVRPGVMWVLVVIAVTALAKIAKQRQPAAKRRFVRIQPRRPIRSPSAGR